MKLNMYEDIIQNNNVNYLVYKDWDFLVLNLLKRYTCFLSHFKVQDWVGIFQWFVGKLALCKKSKNTLILISQGVNTLHMDAFKLPTV